jgi:DNA polymerase-3 subunit gamma/tau
MENFIVSARKYRPQTFDTVVGQKSIINTLKNAIKNKQLAQAFLFCGPRGVGKTTCARILAKTINCQNITEDFEACDQCPSCQSFNQTASFNMHELDAASNNSVDDIRNLVDQVRIPPQAGKYKVYIIDEVHMLSSQAFNAFLKTLEEPPAYAKFILATTEKHKIIPTILSRCQIFDFRRITVDDIAQHLAFVASREGIKADADALHIIAQKADGALRDALSIFDQIASSTEGNITYQSVIENLNILDYDFYFTMTGNAFRGDVPATFLLIDQVIDNGFDGLQFLNGFSSHLRNLLMCMDARTVDLLEVGENIRERYKEQSRFVTVPFISKALEITNQCEQIYKPSSNKRLQLELAFLQMCNLNNPQAAADTSKGQAEKKTPEQSNIAPESDKREEAVVQSPIKIPEKSSEVEKSSLNRGNMFSLKNLASQNGLRQKEIVTESENTNQYGESDFSDTDFMESWQRFAGTCREKQPSFYSTLMARSPEIGKDRMIRLQVDNGVQQEEVNRRKGEILGFLRKDLDNKNIDIQVDIVVHEADRKHFAPEEKFRKMAEKNPAINKLRSQLDLEIDY